MEEIPDSLLRRVFREMLEHLVGAHDAHRPAGAPPVGRVVARLAHARHRTVASERPGTYSYNIHSEPSTTLGGRFNMHIV